MRNFSYSEVPLHMSVLVGAAQRHANMTTTSIHVFAFCNIGSIKNGQRACVVHVELFALLCMHVALDGQVVLNHI